MKTLDRLILYLMLACIATLTGCAMNFGATVTSKSTGTNGVQTVQEARQRPYFAFGDAVNQIAKEKLANTKAGNSIGIAGLEQETSGTNVTAAAGAVIGEAVKALLKP